MAYGAIQDAPKPTQPFVARIYPAPPRARSDVRAALLTVPYNFTNGDRLDAGLEQKLAKDFNIEVSGGRTYPQENQLTAEEVRSYFFSSRMILGLFIDAAQLATMHPALTDIPLHGIAVDAALLAHINLGNWASSLFPVSKLDSSDDSPPDWEALVAFTYYIKPNYPGRSSHLCNAGFVVPEMHRGRGLGVVAGRSFLFYGPRAGFRGSVFNLVYSTNAASVRIWEQLGFQVIGTIPEAGRLKTVDGNGEEYADAQVVYGDFRKIGYTEDT